MGNEGIGRPDTLHTLLLATELMVERIDADDDSDEPVGTLLEMAANDGGCDEMAGEGDDEIALICVCPTLTCVMPAPGLAVGVVVFFALDVRI